jgi:hypothetical protein
MNWKAAERESARRMGGQRVPVSGRQRGSAPDHTTESGLWAIEMKAWKNFPAWLLDAMDQAVKSHEQGAGLWPTVVLHPKGQRYDNDLIVIRRSDWEDIDDMITEFERKTCTAPALPTPTEETHEQSA